MRADADCCDGRVLHREQQRAVHAQELSDVRVDRSAVRHDGDALAAMLRHELIDDTGDSSAERVVAFPSGDAVPAACSAPRHPFGIGSGGPPAELAVAPLAQSDLLQIDVLHHRQPARIGQRLCRLACTRQLRAVDGVDGLARKASGQRRGLLDADRVQGRVGRLGRAGYHIGRPAVANEQHLALAGFRAPQRGLRNGLGAVEVGRSCCHSATVAVSTNPTRTRAMPTHPAVRMPSCTTRAPSTAAVIGSSSVNVMTVGA